MSLRSWSTVLGMFGSSVALGGCVAGTDVEGLDEEFGTTKLADSTTTRESSINTKFAANSSLLINSISGFTHFSNGARRDYAGASNNSSIWYSDDTNNSQIVLGKIRGAYLGVSAQAGVLGYPTSDEGNTLFNTGKYNFFQFGRMLWKTGNASAFETHGAIDGLYQKVAMEWGSLGFPTSNEFTSTGRQKNDFEFGKIYWTSSLGAWPAMTTTAGSSNLTGQNWPRLISASISAQQTLGDGCISASGAGFPPNTTVFVQTSSAGFGLDGGHSTTTNSSGSFTFQEVASCTPQIRSNNGITTIVASSASGATVAIKGVFFSNGLSGGTL